jgi:hypothetical protein
MMRRIAVLLLLVLIAGLALAPLALAAKDYSADRFDVDVAVQPDGSLLVKETVVFHFSGGPFSTVFRDLEMDKTDGITAVSAQMDGVALPEGTGPGQVEIKQGSPINVQWHMLPTSDSTHTFVLSYRMLGVVRQGSNADVLTFNALPTKHDYKIAASSVRMTYPSSAQLLDSPHVEEGKAVVDTAAGIVTFQSANLGSDDSLRVSLRFAPGLVAVAPQWQVRQDAQNRLGPAWIVSALAILIAGIAALTAYWRANRRSISIPPAGELQVMRPPSDLPPAIAGVVKDGAADVQWQHGMGTMLDLARRGVLLIEETTEKSWWKKNEFVIRLVEQPADLRPHESAFLRLLFETKKGTVTSIKMSELSTGVLPRWKVFSGPCKTEMSSLGLFSPQREAIRGRLMAAAVITLFAGMAAMLLAIPFSGRFGGWAILPSFAIFGLSMAGFIVAAAFSPQSDTAAQQQPRWVAFAHYLKDVAKGTQPFVGAALIEEYLPYAAAFGQADEWAKLFKQRGDEATLAWFRPLATAGEGRQGAFVAMIAYSSSVSSSGGAAGAGGAAGGGASGAH